MKIHHKLFSDFMSLVLKDDCFPLSSPTHSTPAIPYKKAFTLKPLICHKQIH